MTLTERVKERARALGFHLVGVARAGPIEEAHDRYREWLESGRHAGMGHLERHVDVRRSTAHEGILAGARSVVSCAMSYRRTGDPPALGCRVASYARGRDYHNVLTPRLRKLARFVRDAEPGAKTRVFVDTAPILEKAWAMRAGIGWIGRNTCLVNAELGSRLVLGEVVTDASLEPDAPAEERCGTCTACVDACPTRALCDGWFLDARRCIAYFTTEHRGPIPDEIADAMGDRIFGCDDCQDACPWDANAPALGPEDFATHRRWTWRTPADLLALDEATFRSLARGSPMARPGPTGMLRNARIVLRSLSGGPTRR